LTLGRQAPAVMQGMRPNAHETLRMNPLQTSRRGADLAVTGARTPVMVLGRAVACQIGTPKSHGSLTWCTEEPWRTNLVHRFDAMMDIIGAIRTWTSPGSRTSSRRPVPYPATTSGSTCSESAPFRTTRRSVTRRSHRSDLFSSKSHPRSELDGHRSCINSGDDAGPPTVKRRSFFKTGSAQSSSEAKRLFRDSAKVGWAKIPSRRAW
jgi:hypothetical protein